MVIAIDGPSGVGKTTVSKAVASRLGLPYLDTGATYRAAALAVLDAGVAPEDRDAVIEVVAGADIAYAHGEVHLGGIGVGGAIRSTEVAAAASAVAAIPEVRTRLVAMQRSWVAANGGAAVVEGRDIGTVVFPDAPVKIFLTASQEVRAHRRAGDAEAAGRSVDRVAADLDRRDSRDATRAVAPLRPADDAQVIDTSELSIDQVVDRIITLVRGVERRRRGGPC